MSNRRKLGLLLAMTRGQRHLYGISVLALIVASLLIYIPPMIVSVTVNSALGSQQQDSPMQMMLLGLLGGAHGLPLGGERGKQELVARTGCAAFAFHRPGDE